MKQIVRYNRMKPWLQYLTTSPLHIRYAMTDVLLTMKLRLNNLLMTWYIPVVSSVFTQYCLYDKMNPPKGANKPQAVSKANMEQSFTHAG